MSWRGRVLFRLRRHLIPVRGNGIAAAGNLSRAGVGGIPGFRLVVVVVSPDSGRTISAPNGETASACPHVFLQSAPRRVHFGQLVAATLGAN
jgi:hypothetical protein